MNIATQAESVSGEHRFVQDVASLLATWGMPSSVGRVYGYLLLKQAPVSLDQIALELQMSKGGAWAAARRLEQIGHARRYGEPGSKRALFGPSDNYETPVLDYSALLGAFGKLLESAAATADTKRAATGLSERAQFYLSMRQTIETAVRALREQS